MVAPRPASRLASAWTRFLRVSIGSVRSPLAWMSRCSRFLTTLASGKLNVPITKPRAGETHMSYGVVALICRLSPRPDGKYEGIEDQENWGRAYAAEHWPGLPVEVFPDR